MGQLEQTDAIMQGVAKYLAWRKQFLSEWEESVQVGNIKRAWSLMPPEMKEWLKKNDPQGYKKVLDLVVEHGNY